MLQDAQAKTYSFTSSAITEGKCYVVTGKAGVGFCMQGTQLVAAKVEPSTLDCCFIPCTDFVKEAATTLPNPFTKNGTTFTTYDYQGNQAGQNTVIQRGGLHVNRKLVIDLPVETKAAFTAAVEVASVTHTWIAYDAMGNLVDTVTLNGSGSPHPVLSVVLIGPGIKRVVSETKNNEGELFSICVR